MEFRNARYINDDRTLIDMDLNHTSEGWIPITISQAEYPAVWADVVASKPTMDPELIRQHRDQQVQSWRNTAALSKPTFCIKMRDMGFFTQEQAVAAAKGEWVEPLSVLEDLMSSPAERADSPILWAGYTEVPRMSPIVEAARKFMGKSRTEADQWFGGSF